MAEITLAQAMKKLYARRDAALAQPVPTPDKPPEPEKPKWLPVSRGLWQTSDKRYEIEARRVPNGDGYNYLLFRLELMHRLIGTYAAPDEARAACELDREAPCETPATNS